MGLLDWIKSLFIRSPKRNVSRLSPAHGEDYDAAGETEEIIDVSGGPLKQGHLRLALRDGRLLPKKKSAVRKLGMVKRKKVMSAMEAGRLFSATMRTRNRNLRDLLTDEEQLARYGLPVWRTEEDVAKALGIHLKELRYFAIHREREEQPHYVSFSVPKRSGGRRLIMAPKRRLKSIQRKLLRLLVEKLPVSEHAHAFVRGRSIRSGAEPHVGKRFVLRLDLRDFFPSITFPRIRGLLIAYGYAFPVATALAVLMTEAERQPVEVDGRVFHVPIGARHTVQGAPTSPGLSNTLLLRFDRRLAGLAGKQGLTYTRYADDLVFSGNLDRETARKFRAAATRIVEDEGFTINRGKTRFMDKSSRQTVTGVVVNQDLGLSRQERRRMRACLHQLRNADANHPDFAERLSRFRGKLAFLFMLNPKQASQLGFSPSRKPDISPS